MDRNEVIEYLAQHKKALQAKRDQMVQGIEQEIEHISSTISSLQQGSTINEQQIRTGGPSLLARLAGMSQTQGLVAIARANNGVIKAQEAKRILIEAGRMTKTKNSTSAIHTLINRSGRFERIAPGTYRLKENKPTESDDRLFRQLTQ
jgi:hypothetical protein